MDVFIPIHYKNIPTEVVPGDSLPDQIKLRLQDKGTVLLNYSLGRLLKPVEINLKDINRKEESYTVSRSALEKEIQKHLLITTSLLQFSPEKITVDYRPLKKKEVPVVIAGILRPASGYMFADSIQINPSRVWVYGSQSSLDSLQVVYTEKMDMKNIGNILDLKVKLVAPSHIRISEESVTLKARLEEYTEKTLELPIVCQNLPDSLIVRLFPSMVEFIFQVGLSKYANVSGADFEISIDYDSLKQNKNMSIPVSVSKKPQWLVDYRMSPENVEFLIEQKRKR